MSGQWFLRTRVGHPHSLVTSLTPDHDAGFLAEFFFLHVNAAIKNISEPISLKICQVFSISCWLGSIQLKAYILFCTSLEMVQFNHLICVKLHWIEWIEWFCNPLLIVRFTLKSAGSFGIWTWLTLWKFLSK